MAGTGAEGGAQAPAGAPLQHTALRKTPGKKTVAVFSEFEQPRKARTAHRKGHTMDLIVTMRHGYFSTQDGRTYPTREAALASLPGYTITRDTPYLITLTHPDDDCPF
jgi:hypothetical protein